MAFIIKGVVEDRREEEITARAGGKFPKVLLLVRYGSYEKDGETYPKKALIEYFGSKAVEQSEGAIVGREIEAEVEPDARESNGRLWGSLKGWKTTVFADTGASGDDEDLPF